MEMHAENAWARRRNGVGWWLTGQRHLTTRSRGRVRWMSVLAVVGVGVALLGLVRPAQADARSKVAVIVMENKAYSKIVGSANAPYTNSVIPQGQLFTNYFAVINGSLHNYLAMTSGLTAKQKPPQPNVFQAIDGTGGSVTWTELEESMTGNCGAGSAGDVPGTTQPLYSRGHDPAYQYRGNSSCSQHDVPLTTATFNPAALPSFSYIVPNECNDMHTLPKSGQACPAFYGSNTATNTVTMGDNWLRTVVPQLLAQPDVTVLITFDEGSSKNEQVLMLELGAGVTAGTNGTAFNHYGLEAGLYNAFGLGTAPGNGATATPLPIP